MIDREITVNNIKMMLMANNSKFKVASMCWTLTLLIVSLLQVMPGKTMCHRHLFLLFQTICFKTFQQADTGCQKKNRLKNSLEDFFAAAE